MMPSHCLMLSLSQLQSSEKPFLHCKQLLCVRDYDHALQIWSKCMRWNSQKHNFKNLLKIWYEISGDQKQANNRAEQYVAVFITAKFFLKCQFSVPDLFDTKSDTNSNAYSLMFATRMSSSTTQTFSIHGEVQLITSIINSPLFAILCCFSFWKVQ